MKPLIVKGYHQTSFHNYTLLTFETFHTNQRHLSRYWQWPDDHDQQVFGWAGGRNKMEWTFLGNYDKFLLTRGGPQRQYSSPWPVLVTADELWSTYPLPCTYIFIRFFCTYLYVQAGVLLCSQIFPTIGVLIFRGSPLIQKPYYRYHRTSRF